MKRDLVLGLLTALLALSLGKPLNAGNPSPEGRIAFFSERDGGDLYLMNADGTGVERLMTGRRPYQPALNRAGDRVAFGAGDIYVLELASRTVRNLTNGRYRLVYSPAWSPDGSEIAFNALNQAGDRWDLTVITVDGKDHRTLTRTDNANLAYPNWTPDGAQIVFHGLGDHIYIIDADGANLTQLTEGVSYASAVSPDGTLIAFYRPDRPPVGGLYVMGIDGSDPSQVSGDVDAINTNNPPTWSPDGTRLAFATAAGVGRGDIYSADLVKGSVTQLTQTGADIFSPHWSPDGAFLAFTSRRNPLRQEIYTMNADGSNQVNRTNHPALNCCELWFPVVEGGR